jgi:hypothetical protein
VYFSTALDFRNVAPKVRSVTEIVYVCQTQISSVNVDFELLPRYQFTFYKICFLTEVPCFFSSNVLYNTTIQGPTLSVAGVAMLLLLMIKKREASTLNLQKDIQWVVG